MPGSYPNPNIGATLRTIVQRVRALETQQQSVISNPQGQPVYQTGTIVNSSGLMGYGIQWLNPATGVPVMFIGTDTNGVPALKVFSPTGTEEVRLGEINASPPIYGLAVRPYGGSELQQVGGSITVGPIAALNVNNTSWTDFGAVSSITADIGPSGLALVSVVAQISTNLANQEGIVGVAVDGVNQGTWVSISADCPGVSTTLGSTYPVGGTLTPGTHTFQLQYLTANNGSHTVSFYGSMTVQPL